jgi:DNA-binding beta-propeller fold protein YncE
MRCFLRPTGAGLVFVLLAASGCKSPRPENPVFAGPGWADVGEECEFVVSATDPDGDDVCFRFDWGDSDTSDWTVFVLSGVQVAVEHFWLKPGSFEVRAQAKDGTGSVSSWSDAIRVNVLLAPGYPTVVTDTIELEDGEIREMCVAPDGRWLYVSTEDPDTVLVFRTGDNSLAASIGPVDLPSDIVFSPDAGQAFVLCFGAVLAIETDTHTVVDSIKGFWDAEAIGMSTDGQGLFVLAYDSVYKVSVADHKVVGRCAAPGYWSEELLVHPNGRLVYVMDADGGRARAIDASDCTVAFDFSVGIPYAGMMALGRGDSRIYFASSEAPMMSSVFAATGKVDDLVALDCYVYGMASVPRGSHLFLFCGGNGIQVMSTEDNSLVGSVELGYNDALLAFLPDGSRGYVDCWDEILVLGFPAR